MKLTDEEKEILKRVLEWFLTTPATPSLTIRERRTLKKVWEYVETKPQNKEPPAPD